MGRPRIDVLNHFEGVTESGCWLFAGGVDADGYGIIHRTHGRERRAHREAYRVTFGPIPPGMVVCHRCDVRSCVNPSHLFLGSPRDNTADMVSKSRQVHGAHVRSTRLTEADVIDILASNKPCRVVAELYGISDSAVSYIRLGRTWRHVKRPEGYSYRPYRAPGNHKRWEEMHIPDPDPDYAEHEEAA